MASNPPFRGEMTDIAALSAGVIAVAMSLFSVPGAYDPVDLVTSLTLSSVIAAYVWNAPRGASRSKAVAASAALALLPAMGFLDELIRAGSQWQLLFDAGDEPTRVPDADLAALWAVAALLLYWRDRTVQARRERA